MTIEFDNLKYHEWVSRFKPIQNPSDKTASIDGCLLLPFGDEWDFVSKFPENVVWSLVVTDLDEDTLWEITTGIHYVNVQGYIVTEIPYLSDFSVVY